MRSANGGNRKEADENGRSQNSGTPVENANSEKLKATLAPYKKRPPLLEAVWLLRELI